MAKKVKTVLRLQIAAGKATPAPPIGPALGPYGVNIMGFCQQYNEKTKNEEGSIIPVELTIYDDRSFSFITKTPPASDLLKKALKVEKGSGDPGRQKLGKISQGQVQEIASIKQRDLNARDIEGAVRIIQGTAKSMGIEVEG
jgi:large subunit ribosomal protein L11